MSDLERVQRGLRSMDGTANGWIWKGNAAFIGVNLLYAWIAGGPPDIWWKWLTLVLATSLILLILWIADAEPLDKP